MLVVVGSEAAGRGWPQGGFNLFSLVDYQTLVDMCIIIKLYFIDMRSSKAQVK